MDIEKNRPVFLRVFNPPLYLVGLGIAFEVDHVAAVFLQGEDFFDGGMAPLDRLHGTLGAAPVCTLAPPVVGRIENTVLFQRGGGFRQPIAVQRHLVDTPHHRSGIRVDHPKAEIVRVLDVAIGRRRQRDAGITFHFVDDPALFRNILGVPLVHNIAERGKLIFTLVAVHAVRHGHQPHIMLGKELLSELADLDIVAAQPGEVFDKHRRDIPGFNGRQHFLEVLALHGGACDPVIYEKDRVGVALFLGGL